jgi:hypothetical protein
MDLATRFELENLLNEFNYAADRRDYAAVQRCYHEGAIDDHGGYKGPVEGYIEWLKAVQGSQEVSSHVLTNMRFAVEGDRAESEARGTTYLRIKGAEPFNLIVIGRHFDKYERREGRWAFVHRSLCVDWVQVFPAGNATIDVVGAVQRGTSGNDDPLYSRLDLIPAVLKRA